MAHKEKFALLRMTQMARVTIRMAAGAPFLILPPLFVYLNLAGVDFSYIYSENISDWFRRIALILYYFAWVFGVRFDLNKQELCYTGCSMSSLKPIKVTLISSAAALAGLFIFLIIADTLVKFILVLMFFLLADAVSWIALTKKILPSLLNKSYSDLKSEQEYSSYLKLKMVDEHIRGKWRMYRFVFGVIFMAFIFFILFSDISAHLQSGLGISSNKFLPSLLVLLYVIAIESWIFWKRLKLAICFTFIDSVEDKFDSVIEPLKRGLEAKAA